MRGKSVYVARPLCGVKMHVHCLNAQCNASKTSGLYLGHCHSSRSNVIKQLARSITPSLVAGIYYNLTQMFTIMRRCTVNKECLANTNLFYHEMVCSEQGLFCYVQCQCHSSRSDVINNLSVYYFVIFEWILK